MMPVETATANDIPLRTSTATEIGESHEIPTTTTSAAFASMHDLLTNDPLASSSDDAVAPPGHPTHAPTHVHATHTHSHSQHHQHQYIQYRSAEVTDMSGESSAGSSKADPQPHHHQQQPSTSSSSSTPPPNQKSGGDNKYASSSFWSSNNSPQDASRRKEIILKRLSETLIRGSLTLIDLSQRNLSSHDARLIRLAILHNPNLSTLKLGYNQLCDEGISVIASSIHGHTSLEILDVGFNSIGDVGCSALATDAVANNYVLHTLYLSGNSVGENGAFALSQAIIGQRQPLNTSNTDIHTNYTHLSGGSSRGGCGLRCLHLTANSIKANGVKALTRAITISESRRHTELILEATAKEEQSSNFRNGTTSVNGRKNDCRLEEIFLGGTDMRSVGCLAVSNMLLTNQSLRVLSLSHNGITDKDLTLFSQSLSRNKSVPIEVLQLSFNQLTCVGVESLMNVVWGSKTLRDLRLDNNKIRDRGAQLVAVVLTSVNLEKVDLGFNVITTVGIKALMKSLAENDTLQSLTLSGNTLDTSASKAVSYALAYNQTLTSIYMDNCSVGYAAQRHVAAGVASNSNSSLRTLTGFPIGAIAVTLGLPSALESWPNDQVLGFFQLMWERWRKEQQMANGALNHTHQNNNNGQDENLTSRSSVSLPAGNSGSSDGQLQKQQQQQQSQGTSSSTSSLKEDQHHRNRKPKKNGPMDPSTVVSVAKSTYENLGNDCNAFLHWQKNPNNYNHREVSLHSPLAPNEEMILETTPTGITRVPPLNNFSTTEHDLTSTLSGILDGTSVDSRIMKTPNTTTFAPGKDNSDKSGYVVDPKKKEKIMQWLKQHSNSLNEVSKYPFDNADMWRLHQHFFSPVNTSDSTSSKHSLSQQQSHQQPQTRQKEPTLSTGPNNALNISSENRNDATLIQSLNNSISLDGNKTITVPVANPLSSTGVIPTVISPPSCNSSTRNSNSNSNKPGLERKTSFRTIVNPSNITIPTSTLYNNNLQPQQSPGSTRRRSEMDEDSSTCSPMQPAQKRAKKARISFFPRVKTKLELLRTKTSEHQALILMRQLKYIETALLGDNIFRSDSEGFTSADAEAILMDIL